MDGIAESPVYPPTNSRTFRLTSTFRSPKFRTKPTGFPVATRSFTNGIS